MRLAADLQAALADLDQQGDDVVAVSTVTSGAYRYAYDSRGISSSRRVLSETENASGGGSHGYGYGYRYTEGMLVVARRRP